MQLLGIDGNAFSIIGSFQKNARKQGWTQEEIKSVVDEATNSDYNHLLVTILKYVDDCDDNEYDAENDY